MRERQQALALITLLYDGERAPQSFACFPKEQAALDTYSRAWLAETPSLRHNRILRALNKMRQVTAGSAVQSVHSEWFAVALSKESPRIVAHLLSLFPQAMAAQLAKGLPSPLRAALKTRRRGEASAASSADAELLAVLKRRFIQATVGYLEEGLSPLEPLLQYTQVQWELLLKEVAYTELALAFYGIKQPAYLAILYRLPLTDAKAIQSRILEWESSGKAMDKANQEKARLSLVSLDSERVKPERLSLILGEYLLAKAVCKDRDEAVGTRIAQKFPLDDGRRILKTMKRHRALTTERSVAPYQQRFLEAGKRLFPIGA